MDGPQVNTPSAASSALWISLSELARRKGYSKVNAKKIVDRLERDGLIEVRRKGKERQINIVEFDRVRGETEDQAKTLGRDLDKDDDAGDTTAYRSSKAQLAAYQAETARLDLEERQGKLRPVQEVADALTVIGRETLKAIDGLLGSSDELLSLAKKGDDAKFRALFRKRCREWAERAAGRMVELAG